MNKKRLIGYVLVMLSVTSIHAQETNASTQEYKLWYMEYRVQNKYN